MTEKIDKLSCVLLIDDDEATNFFHRLIIEEQNTNLEIKAVSSAQEALDFLLSRGSFANHHKPGIIFLDINMPGMNGWQFLEEYKKLSKDIHEKAVVSLLTTSINPDDKERAANIPEVKEFVHKPLTPEVFWKIVKRNFVFES